MIDTKELQEFENRWRLIDEGGFKQILDYSKTLTKYNGYKIDKQQYLHLYNIAYKIIMAKNDEIRNLCEQRIFSNLKYHCESLYEKISINPTLDSFITNWEIFENVAVYWVLKVFSYFSRVKVLIQRKDSLEKDLKRIFKNEIYNKIEDKIKQDFLQKLTDFRDHKTVVLDIPKLKSFITFLQYFEIETDFLNYLIEFTENYYQQKCALQSKESFINYINFGVEIIQLETVNLTLIVPSSIMSKIIEDLNNIIFLKNYKELLCNQDGFIYLLKLKDFNYLKKSYAIFSRSEETLKAILDYYKLYVKEEFEKIVQNNNIKDIPNTDKTKTLRLIATQSNFINDYAQFQLEQTEIIKGPFNGNSHFNVIFNETIESLQNEHDILDMNYLLPYYFDKLLNTIYYQNVNISDSNVINQLINNINADIDSKINILPTLTDKDIFINNHQVLLAHRLLSQNCISVNCEKYLLSELQKKCGQEYTAKVEIMMNDYMNYEQTNTKLNDYLIEKQLSFPIQISFFAVSGENWPLLNIHKINLPNNLIGLSNQIYKYYVSNYKGRNLQWSLENSNLEMKVNFPNISSFTLICNTYIGTILLLFNPIKFNKGLSEEDINQALKFEELSDLHKSLYMLIEKGLLIKIQNLYYLNSQFSGQGNMIIENYRDGEPLVKKAKIEGDRTYAIEGHIIKILKEKKQVKKDDLVKMVIDSLSKFRVLPSTVEKRIDILIQKEFIYKNKDNNDIIEYATIVNETESNPSE